MGSEIVFLFGPLCLAVIFALGYLASRPRFRIAAGLCTVLSAFVSLSTVDVVPSYSFWTQAGFYGFMFIATSLVALPAMLGFSNLLQRRSRK
jgi:hypothetical protein